MLERETRCGLGPWRPAWLQCVASKKSFVIVYGLIGMGQFALASYFVATISTMEKRFKIPSQTSGKAFSFHISSHKQHNSQVNG
jgi:tellurite resistance protein TehA-like permease